MEKNLLRIPKKTYTCNKCKVEYEYLPIGKLDKICPKCSNGARK